MRLIDKILPFRLNDQQMELLILASICNGCGGDGKNIDKQLRVMIEILPGFSEMRVEALFNDIRKICFAHDCDFYFKRGFYLSNFVMAKRIYKLLHWAGYKRIIVAISLFYILSRYGRKFYNKH